MDNNRCLVSKIFQSYKLAFGLLAALGAAKLLYWLTITRRQSKYSIRDKVVLITGASSGIGKALAKEFHRRGAKLILVARSLDKLEELCNELSATNLPNTHKPNFRYLDLADPNGIESTMKELAEIHSSIDVLVNNAGMSMRGSCEETSIEVHRQLMDVNYFGQIRVTQAALPYLTAKGGKILVVGSVQGKISVPFRSAYSASKHAVQAYFDCLRAESAHCDVGVLVVSPGYVSTNLSTNALTGTGEKYNKMDETTESGMTAEEAARKIVQALKSGEQEFIMAPLVPRIAVGLRYFLPGLYFWLMQRRAAKEKKKKNLLTKPCLDNKN